MTVTRLLKEMAAIVLLAALIGVAWNHRLLYRSWSGRAAPATRLEQGLRPMPLGLMQAKELFDRHEALFVDARDSSAFAAGHISGAVSLPLGDADTGIARFRQKVPEASHLVVYCNGYDCQDSSELGERLLQSGYRPVYVFAGGYPEWRDAGYPTAGGAR